MSIQFSISLCSFVGFSVCDVCLSVCDVCLYVMSVFLYVMWESDVCLTVCDVWCLSYCMWCVMSVLLFVMCDVCLTVCDVCLSLCLSVLRAYSTSAICGVFFPSIFLEINTHLCSFSIYKLISMYLFIFYLYFYVIQSLADANAELEDKLKDVRKDLEESAMEMDKMTDEYTKLKTVLQQTDQIVEEMRKDRDVLRAQVCYWKRTSLMYTIREGHFIFLQHTSGISLLYSKGLLPKTGKIFISFLLFRSKTWETRWHQRLTMTIKFSRL